MAFWRSKKKASGDPSDPSTAEPSSGSSSDGSSGSSASPTPPSGTGGLPASDSSSSEDPQGGGLLSRMRSGLQKTRRVLSTDIRDLFKSEGSLVDDDLLEALFARLVRTDMGGGPAKAIRDDIATRYRGRVVQFEEVLESIATQTREMLQQENTEISFAESGPTVILVVGVNGSGKTTSIGKLANHFHSQGKKIVLGAGDTFRAAAVEQLTIWSQRIGCDIVTGKPQADPASIAYQTVEKALETDADLAIIDTAGRLQTQTNLMQELQKIRRVIEKKIDDAPHEVLLVLDSTAGQNAISQAQGFSEAAGCTGIVLAKLDGSAKGGVVLPIREQFQLPVKFVGLGEGIADLAPFAPDEFAEGLFKA
ncbi:MAG: signal recognition particle-docking protein FtsY [Planctomycetota bacterium]